MPADTRVGMFTSVVTSAAALEPHIAAWDDLALHAIEPNPFYESYALLPAWQHLSPAGLRVVLVWARDPLPRQPPRLVGLFPITSTRNPAIGLHVATTWHHLYTYRSIPLVHADVAPRVLAVFFEWLRANDVALFECRRMISDGPFRHALIDTLDELGSGAFSASMHTRACFRPAADAESYLTRAMSGKKRKELRRQERRLAETGALAYEELAPDGDLDAWIAEFLALEAHGWKGKGGTALRDDPAAGAVFRAYARGAFSRGHWMTLALRLDGRALAMKCNLRANHGAVAFKIAYDETHARFSPGVLLELEHVRRLHDPGAPAWMDSGAAADHPMIEHVWRDKIAIETVVVSTGTRVGELVTAAWPLARWTSRAIKRTWQRLRTRKS